MQEAATEMTLTSLSPGNAEAFPRDPGAHAGSSQAGQRPVHARRRGRQGAAPPGTGPTPWEMVLMRLVHRIGTEGDGRRRLRRYLTTAGVLFVTIWGPVGGWYLLVPASYVSRFEVMVLPGPPTTEAHPGGTASTPPASFYASLHGSPAERHAALLHDESVRRRVARQLGLSRAAAPRPRVRLSPDGERVQVAVGGASPGEAARIAELYFDALNQESDRRRREEAEARAAERQALIAALSSRLDRPRDADRDALAPPERYAAAVE